MSVNNMYSYQSILSSDVFSACSYAVKVVPIYIQHFYTADPPFLVKNESDSLLIDHQSILMKDHFMGTAKIV